MASTSGERASAMVSAMAGAPRTTATQLSTGVDRTAHAAMRTTAIWTTPRTARPTVEWSRNG